MTLTIEKVVNGYLVQYKTRLTSLGTWVEQKSVFANLESALSFIKKEFGEEDIFKEKE